MLEHFTLSADSTDIPTSLPTSRQAQSFLFQFSGQDLKHDEENSDPSLCCFAAVLFIAVAGLNLYSAQRVLSPGPLCPRCWRNARGKKTEQASRGLWLKQKAGLRCSIDRWGVSTNQRATCWILLNVILGRT